MGPSSTAARRSVLVREAPEARDDEAIPGARGGHVQKPPRFTRLHALLALLEHRVPQRLEVAGRRPGKLGLEPDRQPPLLAVHDRIDAPAAPWEGAADEDDDRVLQALRLVDREQVHDVPLVVHLRLLLPRGVAGLRRPSEERPEAAPARSRERARAVDEPIEVGDGLGATRAGGSEELGSAGEPHQLCGELVRLARRAALVQLAEGRERRADRRVRLRLRGEQVEPPAARPEEEQLVVAEPEERRVQGPVHGGPVARVVHDAQAEERVVHLTPAEVGLATVDAVRDAGLTEGLLVGLEAGGRPEEQGDVAPARRARRVGVGGALGAGRAVLHAPAVLLLAVHGQQERRKGLSLGPPRGVCRPRSRAEVVAQQHGDARAVRVGAERFDPLVPRLATLLAVLVEDVGEDVVDPLHDRRRGAEVLADDLEGAGPAGLAGDLALDLVVHADVRAAEAVDGLFGVADDEELAGLEDRRAPVGGRGFPFAEEEDDLGLQGVGVLELVDEQVAEARLQRRPRVEVAHQQVAQAPQQVGEVEAAEGELGLGRPARERVGDRDRQRVRNAA